MFTIMDKVSPLYMNSINQFFFTYILVVTWVLMYNFFFYFFEVRDRNIIDWRKQYTKVYKPCSGTSKTGEVLTPNYKYHNKPKKWSSTWDIWLALSTVPLCVVEVLVFLQEPNSPCQDGFGMGLNSLKIYSIPCIPNSPRHHCPYF